MSDCRTGVRFSAQFSRGRAYIMARSYRDTIHACFAGYIVQSVVNSFVPLLFITFQNQYSVPLEQITALITINFGVQLLVDLASAVFVDRIGYRASAVLAHLFAALGLVSLTILPELFPNPFTGLVLSVLLYAVGGGLLEVVISPIVEACPNDRKAQTMSILHSFYCWGCVGVTLLSTLFFAIFGIDHWKIMALIWTILPIANGIFFLTVPIADLVPEGTQQLTIPELMRRGTFWLLFGMMICSGASEQAVSQWASAFAERGLGISKSVGDLVGPTMFSVLMGLSRVIYGKYGDRIDLRRMMLWSTLLCAASYLLIALAPHPVLSLAGIALAGFSVGILWPGTFSQASERIPAGGNPMFALLALGGDIGCSAGPTFAGLVAGAAGDNLKTGILAAVFFPVLMTLLLTLRRKSTR